MSLPINIVTVATTTPAWMVSLGDGWHVGYDKGPDTQQGALIFLTIEGAEEAARAVGGHLVAGVAGAFLARLQSDDVPTLFVDDLGQYFLPIAVTEKGTSNEHESRFIQ